MASTELYVRPGFLDRERIVAAPDFSRWLVPPAALAIHLCIGMAYGFSVFWLPLSRAVGISKSVACPPDMGFLAYLVTARCDWKISALTVTYNLFFIFLGSSAAIWGGWLERAGPRKAGVVAALCWCGGLVLAAVGVMLHWIWLLWLGAGAIGGIGLGLGYISPVSTLMKWFPDRRGMATGFAIMGFGGGAMIGAPFADRLMKFYATPDSVGVWQALLTLAAIYFVFMMGGALGYRVPAPGWSPRGVRDGATASRVQRGVDLAVAWRTRQFWLVWAVLCLNVTAGIGILGMASPLLQEVFGGRLIGVAAAFDTLTTEQKARTAAIAAGFTGLLSLFNIAGRLFWASVSDRLGRKLTYAVFFALGMVLYSSIPWTARTGSLALFVGFFGVILSMYGGGFSTVPAYLADLFGTRMVGAIHGRLLTAWSTAGVLGPMLIAFIRDYQLAHGIPSSQAYSVTMYVLVGFLAIGFICNLLIRPVEERHFTEDVPAIAGSPAASAATMAATPAAESSLSTPPAGRVLTPVLLLAWAAVSIPLVWGIWMTLQKAAILFR